MHRECNNCYPPTLSARILVYHCIFSNVSLQTSCPLCFKLLEKSRQRKPEGALKIFAFDRCGKNVFFKSQALSWSASTTYSRLTFKNKLFLYINFAYCYVGVVGRSWPILSPPLLGNDFHSGQTHRARKVPAKTTGAKCGINNCFYSFSACLE